MSRRGTLREWAGGRTVVGAYSLATMVAALIAAACVREDVRTEPTPEEGFPMARTAFAVPPEGLALTTDNAGDTISVLDLATNTTRATVTIALDPIAKNGPHHLQVDPTRDALFVPLAFPPPKVAPGPHGVHGLSDRSGVLLKLRRSDLSRIATAPLDVNPGEVRLTPDGRMVLVSHFDMKRATSPGLSVEERRARVVIVDAESMLPIAAVPTCIAPHGMDVSPDGTRAFVSCYGEDAIAEIRLDDPKLKVDPKLVVERFPVADTVGPPGSPLWGPYSITVAGDRLVVGETTGKALDVFDRSTRTRLRSMPMPGEAFFAAPTDDPARWIVPTQGRDALVLVDIESGAILAQRSTEDGSCVKPHQVARFTGRTFVVCEGDRIGPGAVLEIDATTLATKRTFVTGPYPDAIAFVAGQATRGSD